MPYEPPIKVVSHDEAEDSDMVVCVRVGTPTTFTDDEFGVCSRCGHAIFFRPYMPKKPPKVCLECVLAPLRGFTIAPDGLSITCHHCERTSFSLDDVRQRYCGFCNQFHNDPLQPKET